MKHRYKSGQEYVERHVLKGDPEQIARYRETKKELDKIDFEEENRLKRSLGQFTEFTHWGPIHKLIQRAANRAGVRSHINYFVSHDQAAQGLIDAVENAESNLTIVCSDLNPKVFHRKSVRDAFERHRDLEFEIFTSWGIDNRKHNKFFAYIQERVREGTATYWRMSWARPPTDILAYRDEDSKYRLAYQTPHFEGFYNRHNITVVHDGNAVKNAVDRNYLDPLREKSAKNNFRRPRPARRMTGADWRRVFKKKYS